MTWTSGAGGFGRGWGEVGQRLSVPAGATIYIKYYSESRPGVSLAYSPHGTAWGEWLRTGAPVSPALGNSMTNPILLRLDAAGTPRSTLTWVNGRGTWSALTLPGQYDLGLDRDSLWTLPPLNITPSTQPRSFWAALFGPRLTGDEQSSGALSVPDRGATSILLLASALVAVVVWDQVLRRRRSRRQRPPDGTHR